MFFKHSSITLKEKSKESEKRSGRENGRWGWGWFPPVVCGMWLGGVGLRDLRSAPPSPVGPPTGNHPENGTTSQSQSVVVVV